MGGKDYGVFGVFDDIDFFAAQFADDRLYSHALHADAGADAIDIAVAALHRDLGAFPGFAGAAFDGYRAIVDFGDLLLEQAHYQFGSGAGNQYAGAFGGLIDQLDDAADAIADSIAFKARLFLLGKPGFGFAEIEDVIRTFHAFDGAIYQFARAAGIFLEYGFAFGLADLLKDHLLGSLGRDATQGIGILLNADFGADFRGWIDAAGLGESHFMSGIGDGFGNLLYHIKRNGAGLGVHIGDVIFIAAVMFTGGDQHRILNGIEDDLRVDALFFAQYLDGLKNRFQSSLLQYPNISG